MLFFRIICLLSFCFGLQFLEAKFKLKCVVQLKGDPDFYTYTQQGSLDFVVRGPWPWNDSDTFTEMIGRARQFIASKRELNQHQNILLWEALADTISAHTRGYMKNHKAILEDGTVVYYSDKGVALNRESDGAFYYFFVFPADGSMHYGKRSANQLPTADRFDWRENNDSLRQLK